MFYRESSPEPRPAWARYGAAVGSVVGGWLAREALTPAIGPTALPFISFFPAVAMAAWYGGFGPGAVAAVLGAAAANWFFIEPVHAWTVSTSGDVAALVAFLVSCLFIIAAMEAMHRANARARAELTARERAEAELALVQKRFATTLGGVGSAGGTVDASGGGPFFETEAGAAKPAARLIGIIFLAAAALFVTTTILVYRVGLIRIHAQKQTAGELLVLQQLDDFLSSLKDTETGQRGYLLTGDEPYLQPYTNMRAQVRTKLDGLHLLALSGELPKEKVERVAALTQQKLIELEQTIQLRRDKGINAALAIVRDNHGKQVMDAIRAEIAQLRAGEEKEVAATNRRANWAADLRTETLIGACLLNLAFLGWAFHKIRSEVRQREAAILETSRQKELLSTTLASIGDGVIVTDSGGRITFLNAEAEKLTGWKNSEVPKQELPNVFRIINERTRQPVENPVDKVLRLGTVVGLANHTLLLRKDGAEIPIDDSAAPIRIPGGPLLGVVLVFRDFSEQKKALETSARLAAIVEFSGDAIFTKNLDGVIQTWNSSAERLFGYRAEEIIGKPVIVLIPPDRLAEEAHILERLRQGQPPERLETVRVAKDGRQIPVLVTISPIKDADDNITGASKAIRDITDLVAAREALVLEKELLSTTLASIGDAVIVTDSDGRVAFLNGEAEQLTGWKNSEAQGETLATVFQIINEQTRQLAENPVEKVLRLGSVVGLANHTLLVAKDGKEIPIDDSAAPIRQPGGPLFGVVLVFRDFTEQRNAQQALTRSKEELDRLVKERTVELREMVTELQHVSYAIAHDMRAPLRAMGLFAELLLEESSAHGTSPEAQDYCRRIIVGSSRLDKLIHDTLNYSRAVLEQPPLEPVDLAKLVHGLLDTYPNLHPEKADIRVEANLPVVLGNESLLTQCFSNLIGNAVKFVSPGKRPQVRIRAETRLDQARIWIEDEGIGIPTHAQQRLFGMFQKLDNQYEGTGIGLAIVRKVVERMGGRIGVESEPDKGSHFWVELQLPQKSAPQKIS